MGTPAIYIPVMEKLSVTKLSSTRLMREIRKAYMALGPDRRAIIERNPKAIPLLNQAMEAVKKGKMKDISRRRVAPVSEIGTFAQTYLSPHQEGVAMAKRIRRRQIPGQPRLERHGPAEELAQARQELAGAKAYHGAWKADPAAQKVVTVARPYGLEHGSTRSGKAAIPAGETTQVVRGGDPLVKKRLRRDPGFLEDFREGETKAKRLAPIFHSQALDVGSGGLSRRGARAVADTQQRFFRKGIANYDLGQWNVGYRTSTGRTRKRPALFDFGTVERRPLSTVAVPPIRETVHGLMPHGFDPKGRQFPTRKRRDRFVQKVLSRPSPYARFDARGRRIKA